MNTDTKCDANDSVLSNPASPRSSLGGETPALSNPASPRSSLGGETPALSNPASPTSSWGGETPLSELSAKINNFAGKDWGNTTDVHTILWPSIAEVRKQVALSSEEVDILEGWEFKSEFEFAENSHLNGQQLFTKLSWEESFALSILFAYYR